MADADLQALLDPDYVIQRRENPSATKTSYYCSGRSQGHSRFGWTDVTTLDTDAQKNTAIRTSLSEG